MAEKFPHFDDEMADTWPKVLSDNCHKYGSSRVAFRYKRYGIWQRYSWQDYYGDVKNLALGLLALGFKANDKLVIIGNNAPQWYCAALAVQSNHGVVVGISPDLNSAELRYLIKNSEAKFAIVEDQEQIDKLLEIKNELSQIKKIIYWNYKGISKYSDGVLLGYSEVLTGGKRYDNEHPGVYEQNIASGKADDVCTIIYTSGTGNEPKGAIHTYRTMMSGVKILLDLDTWHDKDNVIISLPPSGITEQWIGIGCHMITRSILNFAEQSETQREDFREIGPDIVYYEARLWEELAGEMQARMQSSGSIVKFLFRIFMPAGYKMADLSCQNQKPGSGLKIYHSLANAFLFGRMKDYLGLSKARICRTSGTMISPDILRFYKAIHIPLKNMYSTAESGTICGVTSDNRFDIAGTIPTGTEVRIDDRGELICRHAGVSPGYLYGTENNSKVINNGWFNTGDIAEIDKNGHISIKGKTEDIINLPSGDSVSPQLIESRLRFSPHIKDVWVLSNPGKDYIAAVIIINFDNVSKWADRRKLAYTTFSDLSQKPAVYDLIAEDIKQINETLPGGSRIRKYVNLHKEFDPDEGELTHTKKLRRRFLEERYRELINAIYSEATEIPIEIQVRYRDGRVGTAKTTISIGVIGEAAA